MNNSRILTIKNAKFSRYYFYMNLNICGDFQICFSAPLIEIDNDKNKNVVFYRPQTGSIKTLHEYLKFFDRKQQVKIENFIW